MMKNVKKQLGADLKSFMKSGGDGIPAFFPADGYGRGFGGRGNKPTTPTPEEPAIENPPLPPAAPTSGKWEDIVGFYFPKPGMNAGGLVRGGGCAQRGRGRGKMT